MKKYTFFLLCLSLSGGLFAQKYDNQWSFGQGSIDYGGGLWVVNFDNIHNPFMSIESNSINLENNAFTMCDSSGSRLFFSDGKHIYNRNFEIMLNGENVVSNNFDPTQGVIAIPKPKTQNRYLLFNLENIVSSAGSTLYLNEIDMSENNGLGQVVKKRHLLLDSLVFSGISAVKHANGRDWWLIANRMGESDKYYSILVSDKGIEVFDHHSGIIIEKEFGIYSFTPNGSIYFMANAVNANEPCQLTIFDFDRCTGTFSNGQTTFLPYDQAYFLVGAVASANSRYLYYFDAYRAYQFDLQAADVFASRTTVATWDGNLYFGIFQVTFFNGQLAPDGRIYVNSNNGTISLHRIEYPDRQGLACVFVQNRIHLPTVSIREMPNHPNYRLGPIDGSSCDTLGIDNHPLARWRYDIEDENIPLALTFTDLSDYEPTSWHWDFGDPSTGTANTSTDRYPQHTFSSAGIYTVCLTVCNANSCDTLCREVDLLTVPEEIVANFSYEVNSTYELAFTDMSSGNDWVRWYWDHDFLESGVQNPTHTFPDTGTYTVCQYACTPLECDTFCQVIHIGEVQNVPISTAFSYDLDEYEATFTDESQSDNVLTWHWDFGDDSTSTMQNPNHIYTDTGQYVVCLIACSPTDCDTFCQTISVQEISIPISTVFSYVLDGFVATFTDESQSDTVITWHWDFGDGTTSALQNPNHSYMDTGMYEVCLIACSPTDCDTVCKTIQVFPPPFSADFVYTIDSNAVQFVDQSLSDPISWTWNFGDGNGSNEQSPKHLYSENGIYEVCLIACSDFLCDTFCSTVVVETISTLHVLAADAFHFSIQPNPVKDMLFVHASAVDSSVGNFSFHLYDEQGRTISQKKLKQGEHQWSISMAALPAGLYFYSIKNEWGREVQAGKIVKK